MDVHIFAAEIRDDMVQSQQKSILYHLQLGNCISIWAKVVRDTNRALNEKIQHILRVFVVTFTSEGYT